MHTKSRLIKPYKLQHNEKVKTLPNINIQFNEFAISTNWLQNRREGRIAPTILPPLNDTNLRRRPVCLKSILSPYLTAFQAFLSQEYLGKNLQKFKQYDSLEKVGDSFLCKTLASQSNNFHFFSSGESLKKEDAMKHLSIINNAGGEFHPNFTLDHQEEEGGLDYSTESNSKWAKVFIRKNRLTVDNFLNQAAYKNLPKGKRKRAVYDQLRNRRKKDQEQLVKKPVGPRSRLFAFSLSLPILCTEIIILTASFGFYKTIGFSFVEAVLAALSVELFFMLLAGQRQFLMKVGRWLIFLYSVFTIAYFNINSDQNVRAISEKGRGEELKIVESLLHAHKSNHSELVRRNNSLLKDKSIYQKHEKITLSRKNLGAEFARLEKKISASLEEITRLNRRKIELSLAADPSLTKKLEVAGVKTYSLIAFYFVAQLLTAICSTQVLEIFRNTKYKKKRKVLSS